MCVSILTCLSCAIGMTMKMHASANARSFVVFNGVSKLLTTQPFIIILPQILMNVQQCQDHVMLMLTAPTLMEVMNALAIVDILEMELHAWVCEYRN